MIDAEYLANHHQLHQVCLQSVAARWARNVTQIHQTNAAATQRNSQVVESLAEEQVLAIHLLAIHAPYYRAFYARRVLGHLPLQSEAYVA